MPLSKVPSYGAPLLLLRKYHDIKAFDRLVNQAIDEKEFIAYLPLSKNFMMQLIATNKKCHDVRYIEEGLLSYTGQVGKNTYKYFTDSVRGRIARTVRFLNHGKRSFYYYPYTHSLPAQLFTIYPSPIANSRDTQFHNVSIATLPYIEECYILESKHLFIIETVVEAGITSMTALVSTLEKYIEDKLSPNTECVWIRFRPKHAPVREIVELFSARAIEVSIVPDDVCVEAMLFRSERLTVVGLHSSLLLYAAIWGQQSYSLLPTLYDIDKASRLRYEKSMVIPCEFFRHVELI